MRMMVAVMVPMVPSTVPIAVAAIVAAVIDPAVVGTIVARSVIARTIIVRIDIVAVIGTAVHTSGEADAKHGNRSRQRQSSYRHFVVPF
jgi:hypothetical protein